MMVHAVYNGATTNGVQYLKEGINIGVSFYKLPFVFSPLDKFYKH